MSTTDSESDEQSALAFGHCHVHQRPATTDEDIAHPTEHLRTIPDAANAEETPLFTTDYSHRDDGTESASRYHGGETRECVSAGATPDPYGLSDHPADSA